MLPMLVAIESKSRSSRLAVLHSPQHRQSAQLVEAIAGINERSSARLRFLSEELKGFQCPLSPSTPFLSLALPVHLLLNLKCVREPFLCLFLGSRLLYSYGVPQERRRTVNPLQGKTEFLANETSKVNLQRGKTRRNPQK